MLGFLPAPMRGFISLLLYALNTIFWFMPVMALAIFKVLPIQSWQTVMSYLLDACAKAWITMNGVTTWLTSKIHWDITGLEKLSPKEWYLVIANHQSWVDILVLQKVLNNRVPFLKFFLKKELIFVPLMGLAWWALDFPFMKRYSRQQIEKKPELKGKDIETTRRACEKYKHKPVSVMNFLEGTRFTLAKHEQQKSEFKYLLKPRAGGIAFVLSAMGEHLNKILDVTIYYPKGIPSFWDYLCGKVQEVKIRVSVMPVEQKLIGDYMEDEAYQQEFQDWVNELWTRKDQQLAELSQERRL